MAGWLKAAESLLNAADAAVMQSVSSFSKPGDVQANHDTAQHAHGTLHPSSAQPPFSGTTGSHLSTLQEDSRAQSQTPGAGTLGTSAAGSAQAGGFVYSANATPFGGAARPSHKPSALADTGRPTARSAAQPAPWSSAPPPSHAPPASGGAQPVVTHHPPPSHTTSAANSAAPPAPLTGPPPATTPLTLQPAPPTNAVPVAHPNTAPTAPSPSVRGTPPTSTPLPASMAVGVRSTAAAQDAAAAAAPAEKGTVAAVAATAGTDEAGEAGRAGTMTVREQQLNRAVDQLKERLRTRQVEIDQLEELLASAEARCEREGARATALAKELAASSAGRNTMQSALTQQLNQQAVALQEATARADGLARQVQALEHQLAAASESRRSILQNKADLEGDMLEALREQLDRSERELEAERRAHAATRAAVAKREAELEAALASHAAALPPLQAQVEESGARIRDLEDALAVAEARNRELEGQLAAQGQATGRSAVHASEAVAVELARTQKEVQRLREELQDAERAVRQAHTARLTAEGEASTLRSELAQLTSELEQAAWQTDTAQLQASLQEARELLIQKTTAIEALRADRAALQMRLEREVSAAANVNRQQETSEAAPGHQSLYLGHNTGAGHASHPRNSLSEEVVPMSAALGERYRRLASRPDNIGKAVTGAASLVDRSASAAVHILRRSPWARLAVIGYLLLLHIYIWVMTARVQHTLVSVASHEPIGG